MARTPPPKRRRKQFLTSHLSSESIATRLKALKQLWLARHSHLNTTPAQPASAERQFAFLAGAFWRLHRGGCFPFPSHLRVFADAMMRRGPDLIRREVERVQPGTHVDSMTPNQRIRFHNLLEADLQNLVSSAGFKERVAANALAWEKQTPGFASTIAEHEVADEPPTPPMSPAP